MDQDNSAGPLAEFEALRAEVLARQSAQSTLFGFQLTSAGAIFAYALTSSTRTPLLLIMPAIAYILTSRFVLHYFAISKIGEYIGAELGQHVPGGLGWENWNSKQPPRIGLRFFHPMEVAFPGPAVLAPIWVAPTLMSSRYSVVVRCCLSALWIFGLFATAVAFRLASLQRRRRRISV